MLQIRPTKTGSRGHRTIAIDDDRIAALTSVGERRDVEADRTGMPMSIWVVTHADLASIHRPAPCGAGDRVEVRLIGLGVAADVFGGVVKQAIVALVIVSAWCSGAARRSAGPAFSRLQVRVRVVRRVLS